MQYDLVISVVLYHNSREQVGKLIESCANERIKLKLVFVDNAPEKSSFFKHMLLPAFVAYKPMEANLGYGKAHNQVILDESLESHYHLICNPDVYFDPEVLSTLVQYMDAQQEVSLLMPKVTWPNGQDQGLRKLLPTPFDLVFRRFLPSFVKNSLATRLAQYELKHFDAERALDVPVLSGCFMFCRSASLKAVGGFDERFFLYLEDVDLSRRLLSKGKNRYWPGVSVVHEYQKDSYKSSQHLKRHLNSALKYFNKHGWLIDPFRRITNRNALAQKQEGQPKS